MGYRVDCLMRSKKKRAADESAVDITPMIDIVFIMLIFFIVTASFVKESGVEVDRPENVRNEDQSEKASIPVLIDENNQVWVGGRPVDIRAVRANIERVRAENPEGGVVVNANPRSKNGVLVMVVDAAKLAGAPSVSLAPRK
ncbi:MAG: biopolymer transporter ExbD [Myxococcota bacterium]